jgi:superfamily II DNA or RNA helicase
MNSYLGQKGYTILKKEITNEQQNKIKLDLTIKPYTPGSLNTVSTTFPSYRESNKKIYVPQYYGINNFGPPKTINIPEGTDINLIFNGSLREYQKPVVQKYIDYVTKVNYGSGLLELYCAWGKTSASLYIISMLKKKTLVIVHKEFLMNQWIERIQQFLPTARIGKIQGQLIDIDDKDIVIAMLQSLVLKDYPQEIFSTFGLTIIDEVHHISSQTFSNALFKVVTKNMLGLSATMDRKDGTTKVFKMFLGEVIYKAVKKSEHDVEVRAITYKTTDEEFNNTILDYRGNPQISSMISKLCAYNRRTEFIIKVINEFIQVSDVEKTVIQEHKKYMDSQVQYCKICNKNDNYLVKNICCNIVSYCLLCMDEVVKSSKITKNTTSSGASLKQRPKCPACLKSLAYEQNYIENPYVKPITHTHTIVMSHNLNILEYIYNKFVCKNYASVGFYIGGMNEQQLKKTEKKHIILASYSMCSEGLDIPSLTTEFLITPKTDIIQIVGRILRAKHETTTPVIYDFVDAHDIFQRQWLKRKSYYKKQNYNIIGTNSNDYQVDTTKWLTIFGSSMNDKDDKDNDNDNDNDNGKGFTGKCLIPVKKCNVNIEK